MLNARDSRLATRLKLSTERESYAMLADMGFAAGAGVLLAGCSRKIHQRFVTFEKFLVGGLFFEGVDRGAVAVGCLVGRLLVEVTETAAVVEAGILVRRARSPQFLARRVQRTAQT